VVRERRSFLKGEGVVTVVGAGGVVWRAYDQGVFSVGEGPAYEPWKNWRNTNGGPLALVQAAILAPRVECCVGRQVEHFLARCKHAT